MSGVNKVILIGNLGDDPGIRYQPSGAAVANITVATSEKWKDKQTGDQKEKTEWHKVVFFGRLAEVVGQYLKKGSKAYIEGKLQTEKWTDEQGVDRWTTKIIANSMQMLDSIGSDSSTPPAKQHKPTQGNSYQQARDNLPPVEADVFDDDIPF